MKVEIEKKKLTTLYRIALSYQAHTGGGMSGQALTNFKCLRCDQEEAHPNTNTPIFCRDCSKRIREEYNKEIPK